MNKEDGYSITVRQHYRHSHRYCGYGILIGIKLDGINESMTKTMMYTTKKKSVEVMTQKIVAMVGTVLEYREDEV